MSANSPSDELCAFFLVGPTAVGKTDVVHHIAQSERCVVLSADSMLVYKGMNIGTAKPTPEQQNDVQYFGIDIVTPDTSFSVGQYRSYAQSVLQKLIFCNLQCIVTGGTGLYVKSLTDGLAETLELQPNVREAIKILYQEEGLDGILRFLRERYPQVYEKLQDKNNPRRVTRALEIAMSGKALPYSWKEAPRAQMVGLFMPNAELARRIEARAHAMFARGLVDEVSSLIHQYGKLSDTAIQAIGYKEAIDVLRGKINVKTAEEQVVKRTKQLAKRQMTWFRHQADVKWINATEEADVNKLAQKVIELWRHYGKTRIKR